MRSAFGEEMPVQSVQDKVVSSFLTKSNIKETVTSGLPLMRFTYAYYNVPVVRLTVQ